MHGIVALLDDEHTSRVEALWDELHDSCGLSCIQMTPLPHFSWHIAENYNLDQLEEKIMFIARQTVPFTIRTAGLGVFTGENPVVYINIVKDSELLELHQHIWQETQSMGLGVSPLYAPDQWIPHITLANRDVTDINLPCIFSSLGQRHFIWEIKVDRFALGYQENDTPGEITKTFPLKS